MARWQFRPPVEPYRSGFRFNLDDDERELVRRLLGEMRQLLVGPSDNPALTRVFPRRLSPASTRRPRRRVPTADA